MRQKSSSLSPPKKNRSGLVCAVVIARIKTEEGEQHEEEDGRAKLGNFFFLRFLAFVLVLFLFMLGQMIESEPRRKVNEHLILLFL